MQGEGVQALVGDGVHQIRGRDRLNDLDVVAEVLVLEGNDQENIADDQAEAAEVAEAAEAEAETANQDLILLIIDAMQT